MTTPQVIMQWWKCTQMLIGHHVKMIEEVLAHVQSSMEDVCCVRPVERRRLSAGVPQSEMHAAASGACDAVLIVGIFKWMFDAFFQICLYLDSAAARGITNRRGVGKVHHLFCRSLWFQERMADGSMVVSPVSGLKNPADRGTKRLNVHRMKALKFFLGMFDTTNNCQVGEAEVHSIIQHHELK